MTEWLLNCLAAAPRLCSWRRYTGKEVKCTPPWRSGILREIYGGKAPVLLKTNLPPNGPPDRKPMKHFFTRLFLVVFIVFLLSILGGGVWLRWRTRASLPVLDGAIPVPGLSARVEVLRDAHGVPHIRAQSLADAFFAQGYVTAQDRLWQMDLSRRNAEGELSGIFGDRTLRLDIESRTLGFPQVAASALADLSPDEHRLLDSYTRGVNAFIESHRDRLPLEFLLLRYQPQPWREIDSVAVALNLATALSQSWETDLMREHIAAKLGKDLFSDVFPDHSALDVPVADVPPSVADGARIQERRSVLQCLRLWRLPIVDCGLPVDTIENWQSTIVNGRSREQ